MDLIEDQLLREENRANKIDSFGPIDGEPTFENPFLTHELFRELQDDETNPYPEHGPRYRSIHNREIHNYVEDAQAYYQTPFDYAYYERSSDVNRITYEYPLYHTRFLRKTGSDLTFLRLTTRVTQFFVFGMR